MHEPAEDVSWVTLIFTYVLSVFVIGSGMRAGETNSMLSIGMIGLGAAMFLFNGAVIVEKVNLLFRRKQ